MILLNEAQLAASQIRYFGPTTSEMSMLPVLVHLPRLKPSHPLRLLAGPVDLGAMWIHEAYPSNPLYKLVKDDLKIPISEKLDYLSTQGFKVDGQPEETGTFLVSRQCSCGACCMSVRSVREAAVV